MDQRGFRGGYIRPIRCLSRTWERFRSNLNPLRRLSGINRTFGLCRKNARFVGQRSVPFYNCLIPLQVCEEGEGERHNHC
jgi:hypothetical protein